MMNFMEVKMEKKVKNHLICSTCMKPISEDGRDGTFIWGFNTNTHPFKLVHKGKCDKWRNDGMYGYTLSMEVHRLMSKVNRKTSEKEYRDSILNQK